MTTVGTKESTTGAEPASSGIVEPGSLPNSELPPDAASPTPPLQMRSVRWGRTVNTGNYSSVRLDAEAFVPTGIDPASTLEGLDRWVAAHLPLSDDEHTVMSYARRQLESELRELDQKVAAQRRVYNNIKRFSEVNGVELPATGLEELPF